MNQFLLNLECLERVIGELVPTKLFLLVLVLRGPIGSVFPVMMFYFPILNSTQLSFLIFLLSFLSLFALVNNGESSL